MNSNLQQQLDGNPFANECPDWLLDAVSDVVRTPLARDLVRKFAERMEREQEIIDTASYHAADRVAEARAVKAALVELMPMEVAIDLLLAGEPSDD